MNLSRRKFLQTLPLVPSAFLNAIHLNTMRPVLGEELVAEYIKHNEPAYVEFISHHVPNKILARRILQYLDILTNYFMPISSNLKSYEPDFKIYYMFKGEPLYEQSYEKGLEGA